MDARTREERRQETSQCRRRPSEPQRIYFEAAGLGATVDVEPGRPTELYIEATTADGTVVPWMTDEWWISMNRACRACAVTIVLLPTPNAILDTIVLHQLEMLRRIAPTWRIVGYALNAEADRESSIERWMLTPYDEIRFCQTPEQNNGDPGPAEKLVARAARAPRVRGCHQACLRITHGLPGPMSGAQTSSRAAHRVDPPGNLSLVRRMFDSDVVEST